MGTFTVLYKVKGASKPGLYPSRVLTTEDETLLCEYSVACEDAGPLTSFLLHTAYILCLFAYCLSSNPKSTVVSDCQPLDQDLIFILSKYSNLSSLLVTSSGTIFSK